MVAVDVVNVTEQCTFFRVEVSQQNCWESSVEAGGNEVDVQVLSFGGGVVGVQRESFVAR